MSITFEVHLALEELSLELVRSCSCRAAQRAARNLCCLCNANLSGSQVALLSACHAYESAWRT